MARDREPALRIRLSPSVDAVVGRNGVHLLMGRQSFYLDPNAARKLAEVYAEVARLGFDDAVSALLAPRNGRPTGTSPRTPAARERG